jgi:hypothetical protein
MPLPGLGRFFSFAPADSLMLLSFEIATQTKRMLELCHSLAEDVIARVSDRSSLEERATHRALKVQLGAVIAVCVKVSSKLDRSSFLCHEIKLLFEQIPDRYAQKTHAPGFWQGFFLDGLVPHIVCNDLRNVPPGREIFALRVVRGLLF